MAPKYNGGDIVACRKIKELTFFQWNRIYVIYTKSQGVLIKRVMPSEDKNFVTLVSENKSYQPFQIPKSEIIDIALVLGAITLDG
jgi:phage repressor protein C with HTH and peptisase S24 domain